MIDPSQIKDPLAQEPSAPGPGIYIRRANSADVADIHELIRRAYSHYVSILGYEPGPMRRNYNVQLMRNPVWLAEAEGNLAGLLELIIEPDHVVVEDLAIDPIHQNRKLGRWFMDFAEKVARLNGLGVMRTYTNQHMQQNIAIYLHLGYHETHRGTTEGIPRVFLEKRL
jgi:ribosomal protein S18 acetylase RimI-like enzyme